MKSTAAALAIIAISIGIAATSASAQGWPERGPNGQNWAPAKELFGYTPLPSAQTAASFGTYTRGCLAGGQAISADGPTWQAMRLSRNRRWGHPAMIGLIERLSREAAAQDGWPGLLVGDISQPRGGPMLSGHASHQMGIDADIWLRPMPDQRFSFNQRERESAISVLKDNGKSWTVDDRIWTPAHGKLLRRAANYQEVQRLFVHPGIKKKMCETYRGQPWMAKLRPWYGHHYHFHIRLRCQPGSTGCKAQAAPPPGDGCGDALDYWFNVKLPGLDKKKAKKPSGTAPKRTRPPFRILADMPNACTNVLQGNSPLTATAATSRAGNWQETASWRFTEQWRRKKRVPVILPQTVQMLPRFRQG
ncbi:MAG: penicillin-insensitive murein endopeptidase [Pseudomonadota bacterium]